MDKKSEHKFWDTQPMMKENIELTINEPINTNQDCSLIRQTCYNLPEEFEWQNINIHDEQQLQELYLFLSKNYFQNKEVGLSSFYQPEFLKWALDVPRQKEEYIISIRLKKTNKIMACITGVPINISINNEIKPIIMINFLCVHKKLRSKRLAVILIKEIIRRFNLNNIWQAIYTESESGCKTIGTANFYYCILSQKMIDLGLTKKKNISSLQIESNNSSKHNLVPMTLEDVPQVTLLINNYLKKHTKLYQVLSEEDISYLLLPRENIVLSYVLKNKDHQITDFVSCYIGYSKVANHSVYKDLKNANLYYLVTHTLSQKEMINELFKILQIYDVDVFHSLDIMNFNFMKDNSNFDVGNSKTKYYLYNWQCKSLDSSEIGIKLV
jgi:glycylpeptide N-tetradecanoyltransferase